MKEKLLVLCGGQSTEHTISRMSCTSVLQHLNTNTYDITLVGIDLTGEWYQLSMDTMDVTKETWLENSQIITDVFGLLRQQDVVLPMLHGHCGEDGTVQGLLELIGVPYVGVKVLGSSIAMDKIYAKKIFDTVGIPQVPSLYIKKRYDDKLVVVDNQFMEHDNIAEIVAKKLGYPCFIKASNSGSSVGCYRVETEEGLLSKLQEASVYDRKIVVEKNIDCIELECAVLGNDDPIVSRVGQIMPHGEFYTFESKYEDEESKTCIPALVDPNIQEKIRAYAITAFKAIDGHGLSRVDFFLDKQTNNIYLNEINTLPGFTNISMYPQLMEDFGISYSELLDRLILLAKER